VMTGGLWKVIRIQRKLEQRQWSISSHPA
jgi:hypothetical protein